MDEQMYMSLRNVKQNVNDQVEEYYEQILTLANSFQYPMGNHLLTTFFKVGLLLYLHVTMASMKRDTLIQHLVVTIIYEETSIDTNGDHGRVSNNERRSRKEKKLLVIEASQRMKVNVAKSLTI